MDSIRGSLLHTVNFVNCDLRAYAFSRMREIWKIIEKEKEKQRIYLRGIEGRKRRENKNGRSNLQGDETAREKNVFPIASRGWRENEFTCASWYTTAQTLHLRHSHDLHDRHCVYFY